MGGREPGSSGSSQRPQGKANLEGTASAPVASGGGARRRGRGQTDLCGSRAGASTLTPLPRRRTGEPHQEGPAPSRLLALSQTGFPFRLETSRSGTLGSKTSVIKRSKKANVRSGREDGPPLPAGSRGRAAESLVLGPPGVLNGWA